MLGLYVLATVMSFAVALVLNLLLKVKKSRGYYGTSRLSVASVVIGIFYYVAQSKSLCVGSRKGHSVYFNDFMGAYHLGPTEQRAEVLTKFEKLEQENPNADFTIEKESELLRFLTQGK